MSPPPLTNGRGFALRRASRAGLAGGSRMPVPPLSAVCEEGRRAKMPLASLGDGANITKVLIEAGQECPHLHGAIRQLSGQTRTFRCSATIVSWMLLAPGDFLCDRVA